MKRWPPGESSDVVIRFRMTAGRLHSLIRSGQDRLGAKQKTAWQPRAKPKAQLQLIGATSFPLRLARAIPLPPIYLFLLLFFFPFLPLLPFERGSRQQSLIRYWVSCVTYVSRTCQEDERAKPRKRGALSARGERAL